MILLAEAAGSLRGYRSLPGLMCGVYLILTGVLHEDMT